VRARERRRIVFSIVFSRLLSSAFFVFQIDDVEMKFLSANSISEFSHGLGYMRRFHLVLAMSLMPPLATVQRTLQNFSDVPPAKRFS